MSRQRWGWIAGALAVAALAGLGWTGWQRHRAAVVVDHNVEGRGGEQRLRAVTALRFTGRMDVGRGVQVPFVLEQKLPDKMRLEFTLDGQTAIQCTTGDAGWKVVPFRGASEPEPMTPDELREVADFASPSGLLFDHAARGIRVRVVGRDAVDGQPADLLALTLPGGAERRVWVDAQTGLERKVEATRTLGQRTLRVETTYADWQPTPEGLQIARRQETRTEGDPAAHALTIETVQVNPSIDDARFAPPAPLRGSR
ncbi:MAG: hypothetical protein ABMB14_27335 [Myxococcota bacterium]